MDAGEEEPFSTRQEPPTSILWYWSLIWLHFPSKSSPEKEAFKKRAKLQQENSEETDENEAEEVRTTLPFHGLTSMSCWGGDSIGVIGGGAGRCL